VKAEILLNVFTLLVSVGLYFRLLRFAVLDAWLSPIAALIMDVSVSLTVAIIYVLQTRWLFFIVKRKMLYEGSK